MNVTDSARECAEDLLIWHGNDHESAHRIFISVYRDHESLFYGVVEKSRIKGLCIMSPALHSSLYLR